MLVYMNANCKWYIWQWSCLADQPQLRHLMCQETLWLLLWRHFFLPFERQNVTLEWKKIFRSFDMTQSSLASVPGKRFEKVTELKGDEQIPHVIEVLFLHQSSSVLQPRRALFMPRCSLPVPQAPHLVAPLRAMRLQAPEDCVDERRPTCQRKSTLCELVSKKGRYCITAVTRDRIVVMYSEFRLRISY